MKSEPIWKKLDKETKYDLLGLSDKDREHIAICRAKRLERRAKNKGITINSDGKFVG